MNKRKDLWILNFLLINPKKKAINKNKVKICCKERNPNKVVNLRIGARNITAHAKYRDILYKLIFLSKNIKYDIKK